MVSSSSGILPGTALAATVAHPAEEGAKRFRATGRGGAPPAVAASSPAFPAAPCPGVHPVSHGTVTRCVATAHPMTRIVVDCTFSLKVRYATPFGQIMVKT